MKFNLNNISIHFKTLTILLVCFFYAGNLFSQNERSIDTLVNWSYERLFKRVNESFTSEESLIYSKAYLAKAKLEHDTIRICHAYTQIISETEDYNIRLQYCDSIINLSKNSDSNDYPVWGYLNKGITLFTQGKYEESLNNYSLAYRVLLKKPNDSYLLFLNSEIGQMKLFWGDSEDALEIYKKLLHLINNNSKSFSTTNKLSALFNISNTFIIQKQLDSSDFYNKKGLSLSLKTNNSYYSHFLSQSGEILFLKGYNEQARDSLIKFIKNDYQNIISIENIYSILGQIEVKRGDSISAINYFKKADSIIDIHQDLTPETKEIHSFLRDYYLLNGDKENYQIYSKKLFKTDSTLTENYKLVNRKLIQDFEIPRIIIEKDDDFNNLEKKVRKRYISATKILFVVGALLLLAAFVYVGRIKLQKKKEDPLKDMNPDVIERILNQLKEFENKKTFTNKKYNLKTISKKFQTNSSYLSRVINARKRTNVSSYLTNLRINHCIKTLRTDKTYHKYDVKSLAQEFGFNNVTTFTKAFSEKTGYTPRAYIKKLKK